MYITISNKHYNHITHILKKWIRTEAKAYKVLQFPDRYMYIYFIINEIFISMVISAQTCFGNGWNILLGFTGFQEPWSCNQYYSGPETRGYWLESITQQISVGGESNSVCHRINSSFKSDNCFEDNRGKQSVTDRYALHSIPNDETFGRPNNWRNFRMKSRNLCLKLFYLSLEGYKTM